MPDGPPRKGGIAVRLQETGFQSFRNKSPPKRIDVRSAQRQADSTVAREERRKLFEESAAATVGALEKKPASVVPVPEPVKQSAKRPGIARKPKPSSASAAHSATSAEARQEADATQLPLGEDSPENKQQRRDVESTTAIRQVKAKHEEAEKKRNLEEGRLHIAEVLAEASTSIPVKDSVEASTIAAMKTEIVVLKVQLQLQQVKNLAKDRKHESEVLKAAAMAAAKQVVKKPEVEEAANRLRDKMWYTLVRLISSFRKRKYNRISHQRWQAEALAAATETRMKEIEERHSTACSEIEMLEARLHNTQRDLDTKEVVNARGAENEMVAARQHGIEEATKEHSKALGHKNSLIADLEAELLDEKVRHDSTRQELAEVLARVRFMSTKQAEAGLEVARLKADLAHSQAETQAAQGQTEVVSAETQHHVEMISEEMRKKSQETEKERQEAEAERQKADQDRYAERRNAEQEMIRISSNAADKEKAMYRAAQKQISELSTHVQQLEGTNSQLQAELTFSKEQLERANQQHAKDVVVDDAANAEEIQRLNSLLKKSDQRIYIFLKPLIHRYVIRMRLRKLFALSGKLSGADKELEAHSKKVHTRSYLVQEILNSEAKYITTLQTLKDVYLKGIKGHYAVIGAGPIVPPMPSGFGKCDSLLGVIIKSHQDLSEQLRASDISPRSKNSSDMSFGSKLARGLLKFASVLRTSYAKFLNRLQTVQFWVTEWAACDARFQDSLNGLMKHANGLSFSSHLIAPLQRVVGIGLQLQRLIDNTPDGDVNREKLIQALEEIQAAQQELNAANKAYGLLEKVESTLVKPHEHFASEGRRLVHHGLVTNGKGNSQLSSHICTDSQCLLYLMSDCLLICGPVDQSKELEFYGVHAMPPVGSLKLISKILLMGTTPAVIGGGTGFTLQTQGILSHNWTFYTTADETSKFFEAIELAKERLEEHTMNMAGSFHDGGLSKLSLSTEESMTMEKVQDQQDQALETIAAGILQKDNTLHQWYKDLIDFSKAVSVLENGVVGVQHRDTPMLAPIQGRSLKDAFSDEDEQLLQMITDKEILWMKLRLSANCILRCTAEGICEDAIRYSQLSAIEVELPSKGLRSSSWKFFGSGDGRASQPTLVISFPEYMHCPAWRLSFETENNMLKFLQLILARAAVLGIRPELTGPDGFDLAAVSRVPTALRKRGEAALARRNSEKKMVEALVSIHGQG